MYISITEPAEEEIAKHAAHCLGEETEFCLGQAENFDLAGFDEHDMLIHDGMIYLIVKCTGALHSNLIGDAGDEISDCLERALVKIKVHQGVSGRKCDIRFRSLH